MPAIQCITVTAEMASQLKIVDVFYPAKGISQPSLMVSNSGSLLGFDTQGPLHVLSGTLGLRQLLADAKSFVGTTAYLHAAIEKSNNTFQVTAI